MLRLPYIRRLRLQYPARLLMGPATHVAALLQRLERKSQNSEKTLF